MTLPATAFPLHVSGSKILGADGSPVRLAGVNWGGAQQDEGVFGGLDRLHRSQIIGRIAGHGFNSVRLPYATGAFINPDGTLRTAPVPPARVAANPDLAGLTSWQAYLVVAHAVINAGLYAIINQTLLTPGWCCSDADNNGFWYNDAWPTTAFVSCWRMVAEAFAGTPAVGYDIHNEPRPAKIGGKTVTPTWGSGGNYTDFRHMYEDMAGKIRAIHPGALVFCEGLSYAGDLSGWKASPVRAENVVASMHDYANYHPAGQSQAAYEAQMDARGGYLVTGNIAPLWIGEFGADTDVPTSQLASGWLPRFIAWAAKRGVHWCWWELGATMVTGTEPSTGVLKAPAGRRETFGITAGQDWGGTQSGLLGMLAPILPA